MPHMHNEIENKMAEGYLDTKVYRDTDESPAVVI